MLRPLVRWLLHMLVLCSCSWPAADGQVVSCEFSRVIVTKWEAPNRKGLVWEICGVEVAFSADWNEALSIDGNEFEVEHDPGLTVQLQVDQDCSWKRNFNQAQKFAERRWDVQISKDFPKLTRQGLVKFKKNGLPRFELEFIFDANERKLKGFIIVNRLRISNTYIVVSLACESGDGSDGDGGDSDGIGDGSNSNGNGGNGNDDGGEDGGVTVVKQNLVFNSSSLKISDISLENCDGQTGPPDWGGCWKIEVVFRPNDNPNNKLALFLPKAILPQEALPTMAEFPCSYLGDVPVRAQSACCLKDFYDQYIVTTTFHDWITDEIGDEQGGPGVFPSTSFPDGDLDCTAARDLDGFYGMQGGTFKDGAGGSNLTSYFVVQHEASKKTATIRLTDKDLQYIGKAEPTATGVRYTLFIGMAEFLPTGTRYMDSAVHQVLMVLEKNFFGTFSSVSTVQYSFVSFANARLHKVNEVGGSSTAYYASISFVLDQGARRSEASLPVDPSSVMVTITEGGIATTVQACSNFSGASSLLTQDSCAPWPGADAAQVPMCTSALVSEGFATLFVPLPDNQTPDPDSMVNIEFVISHDDAFETILLQIANGNGFIEWCADATTSSVDLASNLAVSVYTGIKTSSLAQTDQLDLTVASGGGANSAQVEVPRVTTPAKTLMDGLVTLVADFTGSTDGVDANAQLSVQLEDLWTLHVYDTAQDSHWQTSTTLAQSLASAFTVDYNTATGEGSLAPTGVLTGTLTANLDLGCNVALEAPSDATIMFGSTSCFARHDMDSSLTGADATVHELTSAVAAGSFLQKISGVRDGDTVVSNIGQLFYGVVDEVLQSKIGKTGYKDAKAWWINPGYNWNGQVQESIFSLSTQLFIVALIKVDTVSGTQRRVLLQSSSSSASNEGRISATIRYDVTASSFLASVLGVHEDMVTSWNLQMAIDATEACLPDTDLAQNCRSRMLAALAEAASDVREVQIKAVSVDRGGVQCRSRRHRGLLAERAAGSLATVQALIVFGPGRPDSVEAEEEAYIDVDAFEAAPGMLSLVLTEPSPVVAVLGKSNPVVEPPPESATPPPEPGAQPGDSSASLLTPATATVGGGLLLVVTAAAILISRRRPMPPRELEIVGHLGILAHETKMREAMATSGPGEVNLQTVSISAAKLPPAAMDLDRDEDMLHELRTEIRYSLISESLSEKDWNASSF